MDKRLGTNLHLWRFFSGYICSTPPPSWTRVHTISPEFQHCIGGGGGGEEATHFETDNSALLKHRKLMQLHKCPKEFCLPL